METYVSKYNREEEVMRQMSLPAKVEIFDTTLRDGEQTPGVSLTNAEKMHIASQLDRMGVDVIEAGFPINSEAEAQVVREIAKAGFKSRICGLARVVDADIEACSKCEVGMIHVFVSTSDIHIQYQMKSTREIVLEKAVRAVSKVKGLGFKCMFSPMDATRTEMGYLIQVCKAVEQAGADIINLPDTVGVMNPPAMKYFVSQVRREVKVPLAVHCHNDFGLAVANTLAGIEAGASQAQVTVNGLGERAGNASIEQAVMALHALYGVKTGINTGLFAETSRLVERLSQVSLPPNTPIVGRNAFTHESGIHAAAMLNSSQTFEPISAGMVGQKSKIVLGKHTGRHAVQEVLQSLGYSPTDAQANAITARIKELAERQKRIIEDDITAIADDVMGSVDGKPVPIVLDELTVFTSNRSSSVSSVVLSINGEKKAAIARGVGPVDAAVKAIYLAANMPLKLREYNLKAVSGGTDALANALVRVEDEDKQEYQAEAVHEDVVMASVNAIIKGMNKMKSGGKEKEKDSKPKQ